MKKVELLKIIEVIDFKSIRELANKINENESNFYNIIKKYGIGDVVREKINENKSEYIKSILINNDYQSYIELAYTIKMNPSTLFFNIKKYNLLELYNKCKLSNIKNYQYNLLYNSLINDEYSSYNDIAKSICFSKDKVRIMIHQFGLLNLYNKNKLSLKNKITRLLNEEEYSTYYDISYMLDCSTSSVASIIRSDYNLYKLYKENKKVKLNYEFLCNKIINSRYRSYEELSKICRCSKTTLHRNIKKQGLVILYKKYKK